MPSEFDVWAVLGSGQVFFDTPVLFYKNLPKGAAVHVYRPSDPRCSKARSPTKSQDGIAPGAAAAPKAAPVTKASPSALETAAARRKKEAEEREAKEREATKARAQKEAEAAKEARERRDKQAQVDEEERHRRREKARPNVLPRQGVTSNWHAQVLPAQKTEGVTAAWPTTALPSATAVRCGTPRAAGSRLPDAKDAAAILRARGPLLKNLTAYQKAKSGADKDATRARLRALFESIQTSAAEPFQAMLGTHDALAVMFRDALKVDAPFREELLSILKKKYWVPCDPPLLERPTLQSANAPREGALPAVVLSDEQSFDTLHSDIQDRINTLRDGCDPIATDRMQTEKSKLLATWPKLEERLAKAKRRRDAAFAQTDPSMRRRLMEAAGGAYEGAWIATQIWQLRTNFVLITDWAEAHGVSSLPPSSDSSKPSPLDKPLRDFGDDPDIIAMTQAALDFDVPGMKAALPGGIKAYQRHAKGLDAWITSTQTGAARAKMVVLAADLLMLAATFYEVWRTPVVPSGGPPLTIVGVLSGGLALGSAVSLPRLAAAIAAIQGLVAIGALDPVIVVGIGQMGGGPSLTLPELQRPTSMSSAQVPGRTESPTTPSTRGEPGGGAPGVSGRPRAGSALKGDPHHAFPDVADNFTRDATRFQIPTRGANGHIVRMSELFQVEGSLNGRAGVFEWIVDEGQITHRRFIPGGSVTGLPNQAPGRL